MSKELSDRQKVSQKWGEFFSARAKDSTAWIGSALEHPVVREYIKNTYWDGQEDYVFLGNALPALPCERGLDICCGPGNSSISLVETNVCKRVHGFDISEQAIKIAASTAEDKGLNSVSFTVADANTIVLPQEKYDLVIAVQSLHHVANLEHLYDQIHRSLTKHGIFFANDYVGPSRMQWTDKQLEIMNHVLSALPVQYRCFREHEEERIKTRISRIPLEAFAEHDPSEGVRSDEILPLARRRFEIVEERKFGCSILYELLQGIAHNFDPGSEIDSTLLKLVCLLEANLIRLGIIDSDFAFFIAKKKDFM